MRILVSIAKCVLALALCVVGLVLIGVGVDTLIEGRTGERFWEHLSVTLVGVLLVVASVFLFYVKIPEFGHPASQQNRYAATPAGSPEPAEVPSSITHSSEQGCTRTPNLHRSSVMHPDEARNIAAAFGMLVAELNDINRYSFDDHRKRLPYSLPITRLRRPKLQIQTALAVIIAELTARSAIAPRGENRALVQAVIGSSGELRYFSRNPLQNEGTDGSCGVYANWATTCERCFAEAAADAEEYWRRIDRLIPDLLTHPALAAARET